MTLREHLLQLIDDQGPIPFELFMEMSLYGDMGFFGGETLRSEKAGDFLTSPEVSRLFGECLGAYVAGERERIGEPFALVEVGAGSGSLLRPLLDAIPVDAVAVEASPAARAALTELLPPDRVLADIDELPDTLRGVILANELIDNLPMSLAQRVSGEWRERWVGAEAGALELVDLRARPDVRAWLDAYAADVVEGGWVEVQLAATRWLESALRKLNEGSLLLIDYGDTAEALLPRRSAGTLRTYRSHHLGPDPLLEPGATDITADVNFTALIATAESMGATAELTRQDDFLGSLGLRARLTEIRRLELESARGDDSLDRLALRTLRTEAETLLHPRGLGDFRVLRITR